MSTFKTLGISDTLIGALAKQKISTPTVIQNQTIPAQLEGKDIIGCSETGSGKTIAYLLPLMMKIDTTKKSNQALIITPTHELALQIRQELITLADDSGLEITSALCVGGVNIKRQVEALKKKPHIILGSAGRILELMEKRKIAVSIDTVVIDEADRMLDSQNYIVLEKLLKRTYHTRQTLFFSATITKKTLASVGNISRDVTLFDVKKEQEVNPDIEHLYLVAEKRDKITILRKLAAAISPARALVFINKSEEIERLTEKLKYHDLKAVCIHGTAQKEARRTAMQQFKTSQVQLLVSSDLSSRGLDIRGVNYIIHFDMPEDKERYLHRAGRTGRAGDKGISVAIVTTDDLKFLERHAKDYNLNIVETVLSHGRLLDKEK